MRAVFVLFGGVIGPGTWSGRLVRSYKWIILTEAFCVFIAKDLGTINVGDGLGGIGSSCQDSQLNTIFYFGAGGRMRAASAAEMLAFDSHISYL